MARIPTGGDRRVVLVRHAETADNVGDRFVGRNDPPLTPQGRAAAGDLTAVVAAFGPEAVVTSSARRAQETARAFGVEAPVVDDAIREVDFGRWEGLTTGEVARLDPERHRAFEHGDVHGFPEGETVVGAAGRALDCLDRHSQPRLLVVTHATVIRILVAALLGLPVERYRRLLARPGHCSRTELALRHGTWQLVTYGATGAPVDSPSAHREARA